MGNWLGKNWVVLSGLKEGDKVVTDNIIKIRPAAVVAPKVVSLDPPVSAPATTSTNAPAKDAK
jgi:membrane fusion protein (multidrug efflux system)